MKKYNISAVFIAFLAALTLVHAEDKEKSSNIDIAGRQIIQGPVGPGYYNNVHIISNSIGLSGSDITLNNSVVDAPVCIQSGGQNLSVTNSHLNCQICVEYTSEVIIGNVFINNTCSGVAQKISIF